MRLQLGAATALAVFLCGGTLGAQELKFASLGDLRLENGETIRDCRIGYRTFGTLNGDGSNAILWPTWFTGTSEQLTGFAGPGKLLDTGRWFVVFVDALGDGVSSSPSNSKVQPRMQFPRFTIRDMVESQHRLLVDVLGIKHLRAVMGISMGGMQTFQWIVSYPEFMDVAIPIVGTPRLGTSDVLLWSAEAEAIRSDREWDNGNYRTQPKLAAVQLMHKYALETPGRYNRATPPGEARALAAKTVSDGGAFDANNWLRQLEAMLAHDIYRDRAVEEVAKQVRAKVTVIVSPEDHMVSPQEALRFAKALGVEPVLLGGDCGHMATGCEEKTMAAAVHAALIDRKAAGMQ